MADRLIYASSNGDTWDLVREAGTDRIFVKHTPAAASGGHTSHIELGAFLSRDAHSPQHAALVELIGSLVEVETDASIPVEGLNSANDE